MPKTFNVVYDHEIHEYLVYAADTHIGYFNPDDKLLRLTHADGTTMDMLSAQNLDELQDIMKLEHEDNV